ncbi:TPA: MYG1 family protein [Candidatus Ventrenecus avicola]|nr:MYG1 family protein [Candidatus Ventrenecus avicola]
MTLEELKKCKVGITHSGSFHTDDVFSAAFLQLIVPDIQIKRVHEVPDDFSGIVFDIGLGEFDHHMSDNEKRSDGIPYASFGKLWRAFAPELYGEKVYQRIDKSFIEGLDLSDNTGKYDSLCSAIESLNPLDRDATGDTEFFAAVEFAKKVLNQKIQKQLRNLEEEKYVLSIYETMEDKRIVILPKYASFYEVLPNTEAIYVVYPSKRGGYSAQGVTKSPDTIELKKDFPKEWVEKLPSCLRFCHNSRFLISADTLEDILKACKEALDTN